MQYRYTISSRFIRTYSVSLNLFPLGVLAALCLVFGPRSLPSDLQRQQPPAATLGVSRTPLSLRRAPPRRVSDFVGGLVDRLLKLARLEHGGYGAITAVVLQHRRLTISRRPSSRT